MLILDKAKLKNLHEVVVRNRLEQLRKRQRDEALQAQEELLAGVVQRAPGNWGGDMRVEAVIDSQEVEREAPESVEEYDRSMSPAPLDIRKLPYDERQIRSISASDDLMALVSLLITNAFTLSYRL